MANTSRITFSASVVAVIETYREDDCNRATQMLIDAYQDRFDRAMLLSGDRLSHSMHF